MYFYRPCPNELLQKLAATKSLGRQALQETHPKDAAESASTGEETQQADGDGKHFLARTQTSAACLVQYMMTTCGACSCVCVARRNNPRTGGRNLTESGAYPPAFGRKVAQLHDQYVP